MVTRNVAKLVDTPRAAYHEITPLTSCATPRLRARDDAAARIARRRRAVYWAPCLGHLISHALVHQQPQRQDGWRQLVTRKLGRVQAQLPPPWPAGRVLDGVDGNGSRGILPMPSCPIGGA